MPTLANFPKPEFHFFICVNDRAGTGDSKPSCAPRITHETVKELKVWIREQGLLGRVQATRTGCLGYCHDFGSTVVVYPGGTIYQGVEHVDDLKQLILERVGAV